MALLTPEGHYLRMLPNGEYIVYKSQEEREKERNATPSSDIISLYDKMDAFPLMSDLYEFLTDKIFNQGDYDDFIVYFKDYLMKLHPDKEDLFDNYFIIGLDLIVYLADGGKFNDYPRLEEYYKFESIGRDLLKDHFIELYKGIYGWNPDWLPHHYTNQQLADFRSDIHKEYVNYKKALDIYELRKSFKYPIMSQYRSDIYDTLPEIIEHGFISSLKDKDSYRDIYDSMSKSGIYRNC